MHAATDEPDSFIEVPAKALCSDEATTFPIFLPATRCSQPLLFRAAGTRFDATTLADLVERDVEYVLIPEAASESYHGRIEASLEQVILDERVKLEDRAQLLVSTASFAVGEIFRDGFEDPAWSERAAAIANSTAQLIVRNRSGFFAVRKVLGVGTFLAQHSVNVSVLAVALAAALRPSEPEWAAEVGLGGLLHDVGRVDHPDPEPTSTAVEAGAPQLPAEDEEHCDRGGRILGEHGCSDSVIACARQHHERQNGTGFPAKLRGKAIALEARIVGIVDVFDEIRSSSRGERRTFEDLRIFVETYRRGFDPTVARVFMRVFSAQTPGCGG